MKRVIIPKAGSSSVLALKEFPSLEVGPGEVRISVKASGLNFADIMARQGLYQDAPGFPFTAGYEVSGVIDSIGDGVEEKWLGKPVMALTRFGGHASQVVVSLNQIFEKPGRLSYAQAAAIPVNYLTAWQALVICGALQPEDTVLIHNVGGGVGLAALDIAQHIGATTIGTASPGKHEYLLSRGLNYAIDYRNSDWYTELMHLTDGKGAELILDPLGGESWRKSYKALRASGRLAMFGISAASGNGIGSKLALAKTAVMMPIFHPISLMNENKSVFGINMGRLWHEPEKIRVWMGKIIAGVEEGWINPTIAESFSFEDAALAHDYIESRANIGKVVLTP
ncbi:MULTISPECIES: zinc-binding dehydrogenase [Marinobacter]|uniref:Zinc-binding dehydrogenase n=1 Tax=Marinobacter xiaoshiensis TaxID=3073652 RepID=A0ABU2HK95_9GAMM|nr:MULTISPECIES: zinc-binding dehydrogenase [unclassified Marinobacter]MBK1873927.1 zinc-binding dehydrogenase [Marinobacter sp. 1-3A]MBK1886245.1 zinc-binding dehydrogenase [Marinobacter sp. DY40_1A1]MDS1311158.1 zinc-binding dehydrogenase [Marinobacter sp. F60267]